MGRRRRQRWGSFFWFSCILGFLAGTACGHRGVRKAPGGDGGVGGRDGGSAIDGGSAVDGGSAADVIDGGADTVCATPVVSRTTVSVQLTFDDATAGATAVQIFAERADGAVSAFFPLTRPHTLGQKTTIIEYDSTPHLLVGARIMVLALNDKTYIGTGYSQPLTPTSCDPIPVTVTPQITNAFSGTINSKLDVVFVIANSPSMAPLIDKAIAGFAAFVDGLRQQPGGMPSLHVGVVSADTGPGTYDLPDRHCPFAGDEGRFRSMPQPPCTTAPLPSNQHFLSVSNNETTKNFTGSIEDAFACIARLPATGCAFDGSLKALRWALDPLNVPDTNVDFLRAEAALLAIVVTNQDDCSVPSESTLLDPQQTRLADPLGPLSRFRCNEFGHLCLIDGSLKPPPRGTASNLMGCISNETTTGLLTHLNDEIAFLQTLKSDPSRIWVASFAGPPTPYTITSQILAGYTESVPVMAPSCTQSPTEQAVPAVRLQQWVQAFGDHGTAQSICAGSLQPAFRQLVPPISSIFHNCLANVLRDGDPTTPALDPTCTVTDHFLHTDDAGNSDNSYSSVPLPRCTPSAIGTTACWRADAGGACGQGTVFTAERPAGAPVPGYITVTCDVCPPGAVLSGCP